MKEFLQKYLGANFRTTLTATGSALFSFLTILAGLPYELGSVAEIIPPSYKVKVVSASAIAAFILRVWNGALQKDKTVTGGTTPNDPPALSPSQAKKAQE